MTRLTRKAIAGFLNLLAVMALSLFLPAWTPDFWQAWLFLLSFFGPALAITLYLLKHDPGLLQRRVNAGPVAEQRPGQKIIQAFAGLFFVLIILIPGFDRRLHWSAVPPAFSVIADGFVVLGLVMVFLVFRENSFTSATIEVSDSQRVVTTGPYAIVRHPMYAGAFVLLLFTPPALGSLWAFTAVVPLLIVIVVRIFDEEKLLIAQLPGYREYCREVQWRLVPRLW